MLDIGCKNKFWVEKFEPHGAYLTTALLDRVLLPQAYVPENLNVGDSIEAFVYKDSEDRPVAVTTEPYIELNDFAFLHINAVNSIGAFADWGLPKDLLIPFSEQKNKLEINKSYVVYMYLDEETDRLVGSVKLNKFLSNQHLSIEENEEVDLLVWEATELGFKVIVNKKHVGLVYANEVFQSLAPGDALKGYVKLIRPDNKIDISLQKRGMEGLEENARKIWDALENQDGFLALTDKSNPDEIKKVLEMSKKAFKNAIGTLYKKRLISLESDGIRRI